MASVKRKPTELELNKKRDVIRKLDAGISARKLAIEYSVSPQTICNIKTNRQQILEQWEKNCGVSRKRKIRKTENDEINRLVLRFFERCRSKRIPVTGPLLQTKAKEIADQLHNESFMASNGWLESFRKRNNIEFHVLSGESADVDSSAVDVWKQKVPELCRNFAPKDIFNADETGLYYRQLPRKSLVSKGEAAKGGKLVKDRLSILFAANMIGEKLKPLVIGRAHYPRAFKANNVTVNRLPVVWRNSRKAWMNASIFHDWLININGNMKRENRKILLFIDHAPSHPDLKLSNVQLVFLPPNMTSEVQPLDQGIICAFKSYYRKFMIDKLVASADRCKNAVEFVQSVTIYDAIRWVSQAWSAVKPYTIEKCFRKAGFDAYNGQSVNSNMEDDEYEELELFAGSVEVLRRCPWLPDLAERFEILHIDDDIRVHEDCNDSADAILQEIVQEASNIDKDINNNNNTSEEEPNDNDSEQEDVQETSPSPPSFNETNFCMQRLQQYAFSFQPELLPILFDLHCKLEAGYSLRRSQSMTQTTLTDFFSKD